LHDQDEQADPRASRTRGGRRPLLRDRRHHRSYEELKGRGVEFLQEPTEQPYGIDAGFRDPSGNQFRLAQQK
jgi:hypothetical protein